MKNNLYQICSELSFLEEINQDDNSEQENDIQSRIDEITLSLNDKVENIAFVIKNLECDIDNLKKAEDEFYSKRKKIENKVLKLNEYLLQNLELSKTSSIKGKYFEVKIKENPDSVFIEDESTVPLEYWKEKVTRSLDKIKIKDELKYGVVIEGVKLIKTKKVVIK